MTANAVTQDDKLIDDWLSIVDSVERAQRRMLIDIERSGVSPATFQVLQLLLRAEDHRLPMSRLAKSLSMTGGGFTKLADRMARDGLIDRRHSDTDRRVIRAQLTEQGEQLAIESVQRFRESLSDYLLPSMSPATVHALAQAMNALSDSLATEFITGLDESVFEVVATPRDPSLPDRRSGRNGREPWTDAQRAAHRAALEAEIEAAENATAAAPTPPPSSDLPSHDPHFGTIE
ncbi:DNA-binding transcriptional regulator, MarR family [Frankineae bacterium MT45]|nr:DNA-binding transcriptional regulator, MarR family [Frankineae bacterium MT45]